MRARLSLRPPSSTVNRAPVPARHATGEIRLDPSHLALAQQKANHPSQGPPEPRREGRLGDTREHGSTRSRPAQPTPRFWPALLGAHRDAYVAALTEKLPQRRLGTAAEAGAAVVFLMSNGFMNGETSTSTAARASSDPPLRARPYSRSQPWAVSQAARSIRVLATHDGKRTTKAARALSATPRTRLGATRCVTLPGHIVRPWQHQKQKG